MSQSLAVSWSGNTSTDMDKMNMSRLKINWGFLSNLCPLPHPPTHHQCLLALQLPCSLVFPEFDISGVEPYKVKGRPWMRFLLIFLLLIVLTHQEENPGTLVEFRGWRILRTAFFVSKKGTIPPFLWQLEFRGIVSHVLPWNWVFHAWLLNLT